MNKRKLSYERQFFYVACLSLKAVHIIILEALEDITFFFCIALLIYD